MLSSDCDPLQENGAGGFTIHENTSGGTRNLGVTATDYNFALAG